MENIEKDKTLEELSSDGAPEVELAPEVAEEAAVEEAAEEAVEEAAEEAAAVEESAEAAEAAEAVEETAEEIVEEAAEAEVLEKAEKAPIEREKLISMIFGGVGILFVIGLFVRLFAFGLTAVAFKSGNSTMSVWDALTAGVGENAFGENNTIYFSLVLAMYVFPLLVAFGAGVICLVRSLILVLANPKEKTALTEPMIYSAAGIYGLLSYVVIMYVLAAFCMKSGESCQPLFAGAFSISILAGVASLLQRVIRQATVERVMKAKFHAKAELASERIVRKQIIKNPTVLSALVRRNVLFYVTFGLMAASVLGVLSWLLNSPVAAGVDEKMTLSGLIASFAEPGINDVPSFFALVAGICLAISLLSSVCRLAFRAIDFLGTRLAFGATAQDRYEFGKFLGVLWRRLIYTMIFAAAYAAFKPEDFELANIIASVLPYAVLMVVCIVVRIIYAILAHNFKYETIPAVVFEEATVEDAKAE